MMGYEMFVFKNHPNDSTSLPNNYCTALTEDSEGFIWVGVFGNSIARYDPKNESFRNYPIETASVNEVSSYGSAMCDSKGNVWFGSTNHGMQNQ